MSTESSTTTAIARPIGTQALLLAVACLNILLFFRHSILSGFAQISADQWDGRLLLAVLDHWRHAWRLEVHWRSPIYFYPAAGAIGYSDAFFVHGALYSLFRSLGANWFAAYELVNITLKLIGFYAFFHLCHTADGRLLDEITVLRARLRVRGRH